MTKQPRRLTRFEKFKLFIEPTSKVVTNITVTFVQAAIGTWAAAGFATDKLIISGAVGAGASAVWNIIIKPWLTKNGWL